MSDKKYRDKKWLRENYRFTSRDKKDLAEECGLSWNPTISRWLDKYDIIKLHRDEEWLRKKYIDEDLTCVEIAENHVPYEVSNATVQHYVRELGIQKPYHRESVLREMYCEKNMSTIEIADEFDVSQAAIWRNLDKHDIDMVSVEDRWEVYENPMKGVTGEDHHHYDPDRVDQDWRHSSEWNQMKEGVRDRDNNTCQICENQDELHVHHIVPVSEGGRKLDPQNLMTLCGNCHREVHSEYYNSDSSSQAEQDWVAPEEAVYQ
jgi:predicted DNA-binding protein YlxM (UPF0122 family)